MRKRQLLLASLLMLMGVSMANAQKAYTYVQQDGTKIDQLGTAAFDLSAASHPTVEFVDGKAVMIIGGTIVAKLPMSDGGQLVVETTTTMPKSELNKVTKLCTNLFSTIFSPFQLVVPSDPVEVYAPTYDAAKYQLVCNTETRIAEGAVIPAETAILVKNKGTFDFAISAGASTVTPASALSGSSLLIDVPTVESGNTLYTLNHKATFVRQDGFFSYTGAILPAGCAYLVEPTIPSKENYIHLNFFEDRTTGVSQISTLSSKQEMGKYIVNGRMVIVKHSSSAGSAFNAEYDNKFNVAGQKIK